MYQQVNLYQPVFRQEAKIFSAQTLVIIWGLVIVLLAGIYALQYRKFADLRSNVEQLQSQHGQLDAQLADLNAQLDQGTTQRLENQINALQQTIAANDVLLNQMNGLLLPSAAGFGAVLRALAEQRLAGVWLTGIDIGAEGQITLQGQTLNKRLIPDYMEVLRQHPALAGYHLDQVILDQQDGRITFSLQSQGNPSYVQ
jgi:hypothetical protein